jgi:hypothetical protein
LPRERYCRSQPMELVANADNRGEEYIHD